MKKFLLFFLIILLLGSGAAYFFLSPKIEEQQEEDSFIAAIESYALLNLETYIYQTGEISQYMDDDGFLGLEQSLASLAAFFGEISTSTVSTSAPLKIPAAEADSTDSPGETITHQEAREKYQLALPDYQAAKAELDRLLIEEKDKEKVGTAGRTFLEKTAGCLLFRLRSINAWISENKELSEEKKDSLALGAEKELLYLDNLKKEAAAADSIKLKNLANEFSQAYSNDRAIVKKIIGLIISGRAGSLLKNAADFSAQTSEKIAGKKTNGENTQIFEEKLLKLEEKLTAGKKLVQEAEEKLVLIAVETGGEKIIGAEALNEVFNAAYSTATAADEYARGAQKDLKELVAELGGMVAID